MQRNLQRYLLGQTRLRQLSFHIHSISLGFLALERRHRRSSQFLVVVVDSVGISHKQGRSVAFGNPLGGGISSHIMVPRIHFRILGMGSCTRCGIVVLCIQCRILGRHLSRNVLLGTVLRIVVCRI